MAAVYDWNPCAVEGCSRKPVGRGWCSLHYQRWRAYGDVGVTPEEARARRRGKLASEPCLDCGRGKDESSRSRLRCSECRAVRQRFCSIKKTYGLTASAYNEMLDEQGGTCAICHGVPSKSFTKLHVDHNAQTGKVRGLLCQRCNIGLGYIEASVFHSAALLYLERTD